MTKVSSVNKILLTGVNEGVDLTLVLERITRLSQNIVESDIFCEIVFEKIGLH